MEAALAPAEAQGAVADWVCRQSVAQEQIVGLVKGAAGAAEMVARCWERHPEMQQDLAAQGLQETPAVTLFQEVSWTDRGSRPAAEARPVKMEAVALVATLPAVSPEATQPPEEAGEMVRQAAALAARRCDRGRCLWAACRWQGVATQREQWGRVPGNRLVQSRPTPCPQEALPAAVNSAKVEHPAHAEDRAAVAPRAAALLRARTVGPIGAYRRGART